MPMFMSLSILLACTDRSPTDDTGTGGHGGDGGASSIPCVEIETPLSEATAPTTVDEVWPLIEAGDPTSITWSLSATAAVGEAQPFAVAFTQTGDALIVTRTGGDVYSPTHPLACRPGPELRIPVSVDLTVDEGNAIVQFSGNVDAQGASYPLVFLDMVTTADLPPTLSSEWIAAAETVIGDDWGHDPAEAILKSHFSRGEFDGPWVPTWALTAERSDGLGWGGVLWLGDLPGPE
ncbi:hypothetical protein L6R53_21695 [Myxococcota bacterium]|nr:hypothetical protein [Myxococcota bacterium]